MRNVILALILATAAPAFALEGFESTAALDTFETDWNAWATYDWQQCEGHAGFNVDWDPNIGVWSMKFAVQLDGTGGYLELAGVVPQPCEGGLPDGWSEWYYPHYNGGRIVKIDVFWRAPFDIESGLYYNLLWPYGKHWVVTDSCLDDSAGWCLNDLSGIEVGGMRDPNDLHSICVSTTSNGGVVLENPCAPAEYCEHATGEELTPKATLPTWSAVKGLYR